ncbi:MAG: hypothetical protein AAF468_13740 [Pseudomonadota bacterium]
MKMLKLAVVTVGVAVAASNTGFAEETAKPVEPTTKLSMLDQMPVFKALPEPELPGIDNLGGCGWQKEQALRNGSAMEFDAVRKCMSLNQF